MWFGEPVKVLSEPKNLNGEGQFVYVERQNDGHQQWLRCDSLIDPVMHLPPNVPNVDSLSTITLNDDKENEKQSDTRWPKFRKDEHVRLLSDEEEGWNKKFGYIVDYEGNGMYLVRVDKDKRHYEDSFDDDLLEVSEDQLERMGTSNSGSRYKN